MVRGGVERSRLGRDVGGNTRGRWRIIVKKLTRRTNQKWIRRPRGAVVIIKGERTERAREGGAGEVTMRTFGLGSGVSGVAVW